MFKDLWRAGILSCLLVLASFSATAAVNFNEQADVRILVDISGSMKHTDPNSLRIPAVNLLIELLPNGAHAGIWTFGHYVNPLVPVAEVNEQWRQEAKIKAQQINSVGLYTNLTEVVEAAAQNFSASEQRDYNVILLTDGYIDMPTDNLAQRTHLLQQVMPKYVAHNAKIHSLALSNDVDKPLLQQLSSTTSGAFLEAHTSEDLVQVFLKAFDQAVVSEQVPLTNNKFSIDTKVKEYTALIFTKPGEQVRLISPSGIVFDTSSVGIHPNIRWYQDLGFQVITMKYPEPGQWQVDAELHPENRIQVLTDMKLHVEGMPSVFYAGMPLNMEVSLTEQGMTVNTPELLRSTEFALTVTAPDGRVGRKVISNPEQLPPSGIYKEAVHRLNEEGLYRFEVTVKGKTFERHRTINAHLKAPLLVETHATPETETVLIRVTADDQVDHLETQVRADITLPNGEMRNEKLSFNEETKAWELTLSAHSGNGRYQVDLEGQVKVENGPLLVYVPPSIAEHFPLAATLATQASLSSTPNEPSVNPLAPSDLNLAEDYRLQQEAEKAAQEFAEAFEGREEESIEEEYSWPWWMYGTIALGLFVIVAVVGYFLIKRRNQASSTDKNDLFADLESEASMAPDEEAELHSLPEDLIQQEMDNQAAEGNEPSTDEEMSMDDFGDFDDFNLDGEEDIPLTDDFDPFDDNFDIDPDQKK